MIFERGHFKTNKFVNLNESVRETRTFSKSKTEYKPTVFISHKHSDLEDQEEVKGILEIFEDLGAKVYIDSMDNKMPDETSGETALRIKDVIKYTKKFVLVATEKAIESYWCNWELGLGDAAKYINNIAILPIKKDYSDFSGNEYLEIYPHIINLENLQYYKGEYRASGTYVLFPSVNGNNKMMLLKDWLRNR